MAFHSKSGPDRLPMVPPAQRRRYRSHFVGLLPWAFGFALTGILTLAVASVLVIPTRLHPPLSATEISHLTTAERLAAEDARRQRQDETRSTLVQATGALLLLTSAGIGAWLTGRQLHLNREGQITERFTRAVDQLGSHQQDVRLGGIYALERIGHDSTADQDTIVEIMSAYVRQHATIQPADSSRNTESQASLQARAGDVHAAVIVLARRPRGARPPDLSGVDLRFADLRGADLEGTDLEGTDLEGTKLWAANLRNANLRNANLKKANLRHADLSKARLEGADLGSADLRDALLVEARLEGADLCAALLEGADLAMARISDEQLKAAIRMKPRNKRISWRGFVGARFYPIPPDEDST
jgi:PAS domain-containing protein